MAGADLMWKKNRCWLADKLAEQSHKMMWKVEQTVTLN